MAFSKRTVDIQLEIYVNADGTFKEAIATRRVEALEDGTAFAERDKQIPLTLNQVKTAVAAL